MDGTTVSAELGLDLDMASCDGKAVLAGILDMAERAVDHLQQPARPDLNPIDYPNSHPPPLPGAGVGVGFARLRGTGPGVSFRRLVTKLEADYPIELRYPFEENERVGGAIWPGSLAEKDSPHALMKLRWEAGANDLPMHTHEHSDRFIIVLKGRGFFHFSNEAGGIEGFTGSEVRTVAARERDVFLFRRGTVHTFSTFDAPMELLSCHLPFIPLDDLRQYTLPIVRWTAGENLRPGVFHKISLQGLSVIG